MSRKIPRGLQLREFPGLATIAVFALVFLYLPILITTIYSFNSGDSALIWQGFSLRWFDKFLHTREFLDAVYISTMLAAVSTFIACGRR